MNGKKGYAKFVRKLVPTAAMIKVFANAAANFMRNTVGGRNL